MQRHRRPAADWTAACREGYQLNQRRLLTVTAFLEPVLLKRVECITKPAVWPVLDGRRSPQR